MNGICEFWLNDDLVIFVCSFRFPPSTHLVLAFTGAPGMFPVERQHVSLHQYLQWSDYIENLAESFIRSEIPDRPFLGVHLRHDVDWVQLSVIVHMQSFSLYKTAFYTSHAFCWWSPPWPWYSEITWILSTKQMTKCYCHATCMGRYRYLLGGVLWNGRMGHWQSLLFVLTATEKCMQTYQEPGTESSVRISPVSGLWFWVWRVDWRTVLSVEENHLDSGETSSGEDWSRCGVCGSWSRCYDCRLSEYAWRKGQMQVTFCHVQSWKRNIFFDVPLWTKSTSVSVCTDGNDLSVVITNYF